MSKLVGLAGYAGVGKTTLADYLTEEHGWRQIAFADALKQVYLSTNPWRKSAYGYAEAILPRNLEGMKKYPEVRKALQDFGQSIRDIDSDFWVKHAFKVLGSDPKYYGQDVLITDVRYMNEYDAINNGRYRRGGGIGQTIGITRPGSGPANGHVSEQGVTEILGRVECIANDSTVEELAERFYGVLV